MTEVHAPWLKETSIQSLFKAFFAKGYELYFVGGCVRNALLGIEVADFDMATNALPSAVLEIAKSEDIKAIPTGIDHGTVTLVLDGTPFEITTYRNDVSTDGRRATVAYSNDINEDAKRRDFTMNALYLSADGKIHDPNNGIGDLRSKTVRFIGAPHKRIQEDYLRILRFFRFHAWYADADNGIEPEGLAACAENLDGLSGLSAERVTAELLKLLSAENPAPALASMATAGVLNAILPGATAQNMALLMHNEEIAGVQPDPIARLAVLGSEVDTKRLRFAKKQAAQYQAYSNLQLGAAVVGYKLADLAASYLAVQATMFEQELDSNKVEIAKNASTKTFPIKANDLMDRFEGPALGEKLRELEKQWIDSGFTLSKEDLLA